MFTVVKMFSKYILFMIYFKKFFMMPMIYFISCSIMQLYISSSIRNRTLTHSEDIYLKHRNELFYGYVSFSDLMDRNTFIEFVDNIIPEFRIFLKNEMQYIIPEKKEILITDKYTPEWKTCKAVKVIFYVHRRCVLVTFDHTYFGGYHILQCFKMLSQAKTIANIQKRPNFPGIAEFYALKCLLKRPDKSKYTSLKVDSKVTHLYKKIPIKDKPRDTKTMIWIIKRLLDEVTSSFPTMKRKLRVLIPVAFLPEKNVHNNVSAIILEYPQNGLSFSSLEKQLSKLRYQVIGGNYLAQFNFIGADSIRVHIDIVLSLTRVL